LLFLFRGKDTCKNIEDAIKQVIGEENMKIYKKFKMRIVILFDAFDEVTKADIDILSFSERFDSNITFVISARSHKTADIVIGGENDHRWSVIRCLGIKTDNVSPMFTSFTRFDSVKAEKIRTALEVNKLHTSPLFILIAWEVFAETEFDATVNLDMYILMCRFYNVQLNRYRLVTNERINDLQQFDNSLGWFAIDSEAVENIKTYPDKKSFKDYFLANFKLQLDIKLADIMDPKDMQHIGCKTGLLSSYCKQNSSDIHYSFMHKTVAEFAVAKMLYNMKLWKVADSLHEGKWSKIHYYLLMHSFHTNHNNDNDLWKYQLTYTFTDDLGYKGNTNFIFYCQHRTNLK
jgi:hypothetical protein